MAIVEDIAESEAYTSATDIPLRHPSEIKSPEGLEPLLRPPTPPFQRAAVEEDEDGGLTEEIFDTVMLTVPFSMLFVLLHILVHMQYSHRPSVDSIINGLLTAVPIRPLFSYLEYGSIVRKELMTKALGISLFHANRHASHFLTRAALMSASVLSGIRLIWLVNKASWSLVTDQAPAMGTIWILTIVQLPLSRGLLCLAAVGVWVRWSGMSIYP